MGKYKRWMNVSTVPERGKASGNRCNWQDGRRRFTAARVRVTSRNRAPVETNFFNRDAAANALLNAGQNYDNPVLYQRAVVASLSAFVPRDGAAPFSVYARVRGSQPRETEIALPFDFRKRVPACVNDICK